MKITVLDIIEKLHYLKSFLSSDYILLFEYMKKESLVIVDNYATVNCFLSFVHTACHVSEVSLLKEITF